jgi:dipeptidase E
MKNRRLLLFSSSRTGTGGFLENAKPVIQEFLGNKTLRIAFIPFASVQKAPTEYTQMVSDALQDFPYTIETVLPENAKKLLKKADVIMTGGGNTFKLLHDLYAYKIIKLIRKRVNEGIPYIGWSAGSNIAAPTICTTNDMPVTEPKSFKALDLLPFQINPHYYNIPIAGFNGETREQRLTEFLILNKNLSVIGLPEGTALKVDKNKLEFIGEMSGVLFECIGEERMPSIREINSTDDLNFLTEK